MSRLQIVLMTAAALLAANLLVTITHVQRYTNADMWDLHDMCKTGWDPVACLILGPEQEAELDEFWARNGDPK